MATFASWQPAARCSGGPTPGAKAFMRWFMDAYASQGARNDGIYNCRPVRGGTIMSAHAEGRAADAGFHLVGGKPNPAGDDLVQRLRPVAVHLGIGVLIWDRRIWSAKSPGRDGRPYAGVDPHTGHVHVEFTRAAAAVLNLATVKHWLDGPGGVGHLARDLTLGDHGADVAALQRALHITADGVFGPQTKATVNAFKRRHQLAEDGIAGVRVRQLLGLS